MTFASYDNIQDSGVQWLGDIPKKWEALRLKYIAQSKTGYAFSSDDFVDDGVALVRIGDIKADKSVDTSNAKRLPHDYARTFSGYRLRDRDIVVAMTGATIGKSSRFDELEPALLNQRACTIQGQTKALTEYIWHILRANFYSEYVQLTAFGGAQPNISDVELLDCVVAVPPDNDIEQIVRFLDSAVGKIDTLVSKKRELIELLQEKRRALVSRCVTRGLPPNAARAAGLDPKPKLKPSGVDWLGDVPEHWKVVPLGYLSTIQGGSTPNRSNDAFWEGDIPWVSPKDMKTDVIKGSIDKITNFALSETAIRLIEPGAVLVVIRGMILAHSFPVAVNAVSVTVNQDMKALRVGDRITKEFLFWNLNGLAGTFVSLANESAHGTKKIDTETITKYPFAFPQDKIEQAAITDYLSNASDRIDRLIHKVSDAIDYLLEYRSALIAAAVTGKIDVREVEV